MPGFDGTGPQGLGPMTGGRRGYCTGSEQLAGRGGRGRGWRHQYYATGLTGWQRAARDASETSPSGAAEDPFRRFGDRLDDIVERLDRLEAREEK